MCIIIICRRGQVTNAANPLRIRSTKGIPALKPPPQQKPPLRAYGHFRLNADAIGALRGFLGKYPEYGGLCGPNRPLETIPAQYKDTAPQWL